MDFFKSFIDGVNLEKNQTKLELELVKLQRENLYLHVASMAEIMNVATKLTELTMAVGKNPDISIYEDEYIGILKHKGIAKLFEAYFELLVRKTRL
jgi:hypothetical protein